MKRVLNFIRNAKLAHILVSFEEGIPYKTIKQTRRTVTCPPSCFNKPAPPYSYKLVFNYITLPQNGQTLGESLSVPHQTEQDR